MQDSKLWQYNGVGHYMAHIVSHQSPGFDPCPVYVIFVMTVRQDFPGYFDLPLEVYFYHCSLLTSTMKLLLKKVKCTLVQALRLCTGRMAHRGSRGIALLYRH
jgi:hypothetical protein